MKRLVVMLVALLLPPMVPAQDRSTKVQKVEELARQLNLTPAQEVKLIPILKAEAPKVEAIKADTSMTKLQKIEKLRAIHQETDPQVKAILTPEQYQTLQGIRRQEIRQAAGRLQNQ
jgi:hypothetical protein